MPTSNPLPNPDEDLVPTDESQPKSAATEAKPFVLPSRTGGTGGKDKSTSMLLIAGALVVVLIVFFGFISTKGSHKKTVSSANDAAKPNLGRVVTPSAPGQLVPADKMAVAPATPKSGALEANDIEKTKARMPAAPGLASNSPSNSKVVTPGNRALGDIPPFQQPNTDAEHLKNWSPEPYSGAAHGNNSQTPQESQREQDQYAKPSMVFVAHETSLSPNSGRVLQPEPDNFGLQSGFHVAARLEMMASTALRAPVTAVIEYNYERDGKVLIPAGARAIGKITQADASGIVNIDFSSIEIGDNPPIPISAIGASASLQAIKGDVSGKNSGRSFAVRSMAGLGEAGAMLIGQGNLNGAVSESDLIRQRAAENIGNSADAQVMNLAVTQHIVVSVPAGTEIYLVFTKPQRVNPTGAQSIAVASNP
jgi:hypothetical protein